MDISTASYSTKQLEYPKSILTNETERSASPIGQGNRFLESLSQNKFKENIKEYLSPDSEGRVNEEQMQFAIVNTILTSKSIKLGDEFSKNFAKASASGSSVEDNVKVALAGLVESKMLTSDEANTINGISFDAAQLDSNSTALYDSKGGGSDFTIAVADLDDAMSKASEMIEGMRIGKFSINDRKLSVPSNSKNSLGLEAVSEINQEGSGDVGRPVGSSSSGFLWKPISESDGKLVVLMPSTLAGDVSSVEIYSSLPPVESSFLDSGKYSSNANDGRDHFRFSKEGGSYPDGSYIVAKFKNGNFTTFRIGDSSSRN